MPLRFVPVRRYLSSPVRSIRADAPLTEAHRVLREYTLSALAVTDGDGALVGVVSRTDLLRVGRVSEHRLGRTPLLDLPAQEVSTVMTSPVVSVDPEETMRGAAERMVRHKIHRVFVVESGRLVGVLSTRDVMAAVRDARITTPLSDVMSAPVLTIDAGETVAAATDRLNDAHVAGLVVLEEERPVGVFTQVEALQSRDDSATTVVEERMNYAMLCLDLKTPLYRAAAQAHATSVRRIIAVEGRRIWGVVTGIDFARAAAL